jgi:putative oxidoreductase
VTDSANVAAGPPWRSWLLNSHAPKAVILIRLVVGGIFLSEGIQKFLFPTERGPGRFAEETPLPVPTFFGYLSGTFEIICGSLLLLGLLTRLAAIPMIINMIGAEIFTKFPILARDGVWDYLHEARTELGQLFGSLFLLVVGAGAWSIDRILARRLIPAIRRSHTAAP